MLIFVPWLVFWLLVIVGLAALTVGLIALGDCADRAKRDYAGYDEWCEDPTERDARAWR